MCKVAHITTEGEITITDLNSEFVDYRTLSEGVGGMVEPVMLRDFDLWCNENGLYEGLTVNTIATKLWLDSYPTASNPILGNVVITGGCDEDGETVGLSEQQVALIEALKN